MFRPIAGPFLGSMQAGDAGASVLARRLENCFAGLALLAAVLIWAGAYWLVDQPDPHGVFMVSCLAVLLLSMVGLWLVRLACEQYPETVRGIYESVFRQLGHGQPAAVRRMPMETDCSVAGLIVELVAHGRRQQERWDSGDGRAAAAQDAEHSVAESAAGEGRHTAIPPQQASAAADPDSFRPASDAAAIACSAEGSESVLGQAADGAIRVAASVRETSAAIEDMTATAARLSQVTRDRCGFLANQHEKLARLDAHFDQLERGLVATNLLARSAEAQAGDDAAAAMAQQVQALAHATRLALNDMVELVRTMRADAAAERHPMAEIGELLHKNDLARQVVVQAVLQQGEEIGRLLNAIYEARSGFVVLRDGVDAVARARAKQAGPAWTFRQIAQTRPDPAAIATNPLG